MSAEYYYIHELQNVLFAHLISPRLAASEFARPGGVALASQEELQLLAQRRKKLLHLTGLPPARRPGHWASAARPRWQALTIPAERAAQTENLPHVKEPRRHIA